ncbi:hypothetical protein DMENIID0001_027360 [Sergentomyia squamirostris]
MKRVFQIFLFLKFFIVISIGIYSDYVEEVYKWRRIEYEDLPIPENTWIGPFKYYIPENNNIMSMHYHPASGLMLNAVLRVRPGIPVTVAAFVSMNIE